VLACAARCGDAAVAVAEAALADDPRARLPEAPPTLPAFWDAAALPAPVLTASGRALPERAIDAIGELMAVSPLGQPHRGLDAVRDGCEATSLAELAQELCVRWLVAGEGLEALWALRALAIFPDDAGVRLAAYLLRAWDDRGDRARGDEAVAVLAHIGTPLALLHVAVLARWGRTSAIRAAATTTFAEVAKARGIGLDALADRSVPDLGLGRDGSLALDYGPRSLQAGFDEHLEPFLRGPDGERLTRLPPPEPGDDVEKAADAEALWRRLKRDASALAALAIERLEEAMTSRRAIAAADFDACYRRHPLVQHLARRVVWLTPDGASFRIAEDGSLADEHDGTFTLGAAASVRVAHPLELAAEALARWSTLFSDYEILQPFAQLARPLFRVEEPARAEVARFAGRALTPEHLAQLARLGFRESARGGAGLWRTLPSGAYRATVVIDPGPMSPRPGPRTLTRLWFAAVDDPATPVALGDVPPIDYSEALHAVETATR
jgi:hypothetical protein